MPKPKHEARTKIWTEKYSLEHNGPIDSVIISMFSHLSPDRRANVMKELEWIVSKEEDEIEQ